MVNTVGTYNRNISKYGDSGRYIPITITITNTILLLRYSWGSLLWGSGFSLFFLGGIQPGCFCKLGVLVVGVLVKRAIVSYGQDCWLTKKTWLLYKDFSGGLNITPA